MKKKYNLFLEKGGYETDKRGIYISHLIWGNGETS